MPRTLNLPEPLSEELEEASLEGVSPTEHATLLLYIATALHEAGKTATPFQEAVRTFLASRSLDAERVAAVFDELVRFCVTAPTGAGKTAAALAAAHEAGKTAHYVLPYEALLEWRSAVVHHSVDVSLQAVSSPLPPIEETVQARGRIQRETAPKVNETLQTPEEWTKAFEEWVASHHDITAVVLDDSREAIYGDGNRG